MEEVGIVLVELSDIFSEEMDKPFQLSRNNSGKMYFIDSCGVIINTIGTKLVRRHVAAIPVNVGIGGLENQGSPTVVDFYVNVLDVMIREWNELVIGIVAIRCEHIRQIVIRTIVDADHIAEYTLVVERVGCRYRITSRHGKQIAENN